MKIRIEEIGDIKSKYRYLEIFLIATNEMFLRITISDERKLLFNFFVFEEPIILDHEEMLHILKSAQTFLPKALKDEDDFNDWIEKKDSSD